MQTSRLAHKARAERRILSIAAVLALIAIPASALAQVPEDIYQAMLKIGQMVDPSCTAKLYRPLMPAQDYNSDATPLYPGVLLQRDISFGPDAKDLADVFASEKGSSGRPVLVYIPGSGNKIEQQTTEANAFYDNIGRWATKNGMIGVIMQRHPGANWDDPARDVSLMLQWIQTNISKYQGDPNQVFAWAHSDANRPLGTYIGRPELHTPKGVGLRGAIFMSGQWNIAPLVTRESRGGAPAASAGSTCGAGDRFATDGAIIGPSSASPAVGHSAAPGAGSDEFADGAVDADTQLARSTLPELRRTKVALLFGNAELDPDVNGAMSEFYQTLHDDLCKVGKSQCPTLLFGKRQNQMSEVFAIDTKDTSISGALLAWMKKVK